MKIEYKSLIDCIVDAQTTALKGNREIKHIILNEQELKELKDAQASWRFDPSKSRPIEEPLKEVGTVAGIKLFARDIDKLKKVLFKGREKL